MGNILITQEGVETNTIKEDCRNYSLYNFYTMLNDALTKGDSCFMTQEAYQHKYSYGEFFPAFVNLTWEEFQKQESLKGIDFNTYNYITNNFKLHYPKQIESEKEFEQKSNPIGKGGFEHTDSPDDFLCNLLRWENWHINHLTNHPEDIKWDDNSPFIPNKNGVYKILNDEILTYIREKYEDRINKGQEVKDICKELFADKEYHINEDNSNRIKENAKALFFHSVVMASKAKELRIAYCKEIGKRVCQVNYYQYNAKLSTKEKLACGSSRQIYSIVKDGREQYISLDFHKGMFEFHDEQGTHLGEYFFDGTMNKNAEESHNLRKLDNNNF